MHGVNSSTRSQLGTIQAAGFNRYCILKADADNNSLVTEVCNRHNSGKVIESNSLGELTALTAIVLETYFFKARTNW